jgi:hypothetical protein
MSWGYRVVIILVVFVIGMLVMLYIAMQQNNDMIDSNYYDKELKYQEVINAKENLSRLHDSVFITATDSIVKIKIPIAAISEVKDGSIEFIRSSNMKKDRLIPLQTDLAGVQIISRSQFIKGAYRVRIKWTSKTVPYYDERDVYMN